MTRGAGLVAGIVRGWRSPRAEMRAVLDEGPRESTILAWIYLAALIGFVAGLPGAVTQAGALGEDALPGVLAGRLFAAIFLFPLVVYGLAAAERLVSRTVGGRASFRDSRAALAWALVVVIPVVVLDAILGALGGALGAPDWLATLRALLAAVGFAWIWSNFAAEAEKIDATSKFFVVLVIIFGFLPVFALIGGHAVGEG